MKYLKITLGAFIISLCLCLTGVNATQYLKIRNITIKSFKAEWWSQQVDKGWDGEYHQKVKKISAKDKVSGDGRAIEGKILKLLGRGESTEYKTLPQGTNVDFGDGTVEAGGYKLAIRSKKWLATDAIVGVNWDLGTLMDSGSVPYPVAGN